jgi:2'-5' RNA ligase
MARLFVAVVPPESLLDRLDELDRPDGAGVRWNRRTQWHITLCFLGEVDRDRAVGALRGLVAPRAVADLGPAVGRLGERVICVPIAGLDGLAAAVARAMEGVGPSEGQRSFRAHLTLGRARSAGSTVPLVGTPWQARFPVDRVTLVESHLGQGPAHYETVAEQLLTP